MWYRQGRELKSWKTWIAFKLCMHWQSNSHGRCLARVSHCMMRTYDEHAVLLRSRCHQYYWLVHWACFKFCETSSVRLTSVFCCCSLPWLSAFHSIGIIGLWHYKCGSSWEDFWRWSYMLGTLLAGNTEPELPKEPEKLGQSFILKKYVSKMAV